MPVMRKRILKATKVQRVTRKEVIRLRQWWEGILGVFLTEVIDKLYQLIDFS
jgi:hypothetical protein